MNAEPDARRDRLWVYAVLPAVVLNLAGCMVFGAYYGLAAQQSALVASVRPGQVFFALYAFITVVEWAFAAAVMIRLRRAGLSVTSLVAPDGASWRFEWLPAILVFIAFNALFGTYVAIYARFLGGWPRFPEWAAWQRALMIGFVPVTAAFCEELIWRGYILSRLEARGRGRWSAIVLSAVSFALIHGVLPDRLLVTFLLGIAAGYYYTRERNLVPLVFTHWFVDVWRSFALSAFAG